MKKLLAAMLIGLTALTGCGKQKSEDRVYQDMLVGMWIQSSETGGDPDDYGRMSEFSVFEFTADNKTIAYIVSGGTVSVYDLNEYSISKGEYITSDNGVEQRAKLQFDEDRMFWSTDEEYAEFRRFGEDEMKKYGISPYNPDLTG
jgi:hypothetical protein